MDWHEFFTYDAEAGRLIWKHRPESHFTSARIFKTWNKKWALKPAGNHAFDSRRGLRMRVYVWLSGKNYCAHRIIWEMFNSRITDRMEIDHIDCDPWNNRLSNIRLATRSQNNSNKRLTTANKFGLKGVSAHRSRFRADIRFAGTIHYLGLFDTPEAAHEAYVLAAIEHHGAFARAK